MKKFTKKKKILVLFLLILTLLSSVVIYSVDLKTLLSSMESNPYLSTASIIFGMCGVLLKGKTSKAHVLQFFWTCLISMGVYYLPFEFQIFFLVCWVPFLGLFLYLGFYLVKELKKILGLFSMAIILLGIEVVSKIFYDTQVISLIYTTSWALIGGLIVIFLGLLYKEFKKMIEVVRVINITSD